MTGVSSWGENAEDAFDQCLVEMGLGDVRIIKAEGAMLPLGFQATTPENLPMGHSWNATFQLLMLGQVAMLAQELHGLIVGRQKASSVQL